MKNYAVYRNGQNRGSEEEIPRLRGAAPGIYTSDGGLVPWEECVCGGIGEVRPGPQIVCAHGKTITDAVRFPEGADLVIPEGITGIGSDAFSWRHIRSVFFPDSLLSVWCGAFGSSDLMYISFGRGLKSVGAGAFASVRIRFLNLPAGLREIGFGAFAGTGIFSLFVPDSVSCIGKEAFSRCPCLETVMFPRTDTVKCGGALFADCPSLKNVLLPPLSSASGMSGDGCVPASVYFRRAGGDAPQNSVPSVRPEPRILRRKTPSA